MIITDLKNPNYIYLKKFLKIILKTLAILAGVLLILYIAVFTYISINKKSIISQVNSEIGKKINGKVSIKDIELSFFRDFPKISVLLNNVSVTDSMIAQHKHPLFHASLL